MEEERQKRERSEEREAGARRPLSQALSPPPRPVRGSLPPPRCAIAPPSLPQATSCLRLGVHWHGGAWAGQDAPRRRGTQGRRAQGRQQRRAAPMCPPPTLTFRRRQRLRRVRDQQRRQVIILEDVRLDEAARVHGVWSGLGGGEGGEMRGVRHCISFREPPPPHFFLFFRRGCHTLLSQHQHFKPWRPSRRLQQAVRVGGIELQMQGLPPFDHSAGQGGKVATPRFFVLRSCPPTLRRPATGLGGTAPSLTL